MIRFETFERRGLRGRRWYFRVVSEGNNEPLAQSEAYNSKQARDVGIARVQAGAGEARVIPGQAQMIEKIALGVLALVLIVRGYRRFKEWA